MDKLFADLLAFLNANPALWVFLVLSFATWIASIIVVLKSRMFLRKGLWLLLTLLTFSIGWGIGPGESFSLGIPLGSLIIIGRRLFGRGPTSEERAEWGEKRRIALAGSPAYAWRVWTLRIVYGVATAATLVVGGLTASGAMFDAFGPEFRQAFGEAILVPFQIFTGLFVFGLAALYGYLATRPWWWGKILLVWPGLSWTMFGVAGQLVFRPCPVVAAVLACGLLMLAAAVAAQIADPRFSGPHLRTSSV